MILENEEFPEKTETIVREIYPLSDTRATSIATAGKDVDVIANVGNSTIFPTYGSYRLIGDGGLEAHGQEVTLGGSGITTLQNGTGIIWDGENTVGLKDGDDCVIIEDNTNGPTLWAKIPEGDATSSRCIIDVNFLENEIYRAKTLTIVRTINLN